MKCNPWTVALVAAGIVSLPALTQAEEKPSSVLTALTPTTLSGAVDTSAQWNLGTGNDHTPTYAFSRGKADGFNLNVVELNLEKPADEAAAWSAGYKASIIAGPDANALNTQSSGLFTGSDFGIKQAYVDLHAPVGNGLSAKVGVWDTISSYEVFNSWENPNFTRSYGYTINPTTFTGILLSYTVADWFTINGGVANEVSPTINSRSNPPKAESFKTYLASMVFTAPTNMGAIGGSTLTVSVINGYDSSLNQGTDINGVFQGDNSTGLYGGVTFNTPLSTLKVGACYDYLFASDKPDTTTGSHGKHAEAVAGYVTFQATEKLTLNARGEYASADVTFGGAPVLGNNGNPNGVNKVFAATLTAQYDLWKNVMSRIEFRWDHAADGSNAYGLTDPATGGGSLKNSYILMANFVYKF